MTEITPGMANGPITEEPLVVWRKSVCSMSNGACVEVAVVEEARHG